MAVTKQLSDYVNRIAPDKTYTLTDFINSKDNDEITYYNFSILEKIGNIEHLDHNLFEDYLDEIESVCQTVELTNEEYSKYKYAPDLLAFDTYGSTQFDFIVMLVNDMVDPKEFVQRTIKLPYASALVTLLANIYSVELPYIELNRSEIRKITDSPTT
jgi:hypothetical protein